jgi:hypothetical protein
MPDEQTTSKCCAGLEERFDEWRACAETAMRKEPAKAALWAFFIGMCCAILPVGRILGAVTRAAFALLRPALFFLGVVRIAEEFDRRRGGQ